MLVRLSFLIFVGLQEVLILVILVLIVILVDLRLSQRFAIRVPQSDLRLLFQLIVVPKQGRKEKEKCLSDLINVALFEYEFLLAIVARFDLFLSLLLGFIAQNLDAALEILIKLNRQVR